jgi:poly(hydroxyalkanoate) depolymerase family esterase
VYGLQRTLETLRANRASWQKLSHPLPLDFDVQPPGFLEMRSFGSNPGALRMFTHIPSFLPLNPALVVVLHGCSQTGGAYSVDTGWKSLADWYGFALLLPQQQKTNNQKGCFNWFQPSDTRRDQGEALSIRQMIETLVVDQSIDTGRVFVTGLSAGGAMSTVMLACYPEIFAAGAIIAGLPYGAANNVQQAFEAMYQSPSRSAAEWASLVRTASPHRETWPRISIWHGERDKTVVPANATELVKQWTALHGVLDAPKKTTVRGVSKTAWLNDAGAEMVQYFSIPGLGHGTPVAPGTAYDEGGRVAPFVLDAGIASSFHIAQFFGLINLPSGDSTKLQPSEEPSRQQVFDPHSIRSLGGDPASGNQPIPQKTVKATIEAALRSAGLLR